MVRRWLAVVLVGWIVGGRCAWAHDGNNDAASVHACVRKKTGAMRVVAATSGACKKSETALHFALDGAARVYGDGSAGARTITSTENWVTNPGLIGNTQFTDFTVAAGVTLFVPTGTIIRCTGSWTNNGTVVVRLAGGSGTLDGMVPFLVPAQLDAPAGFALRAAGSGESGDATQPRSRGREGLGVNPSIARFLLRPGPAGGGSGAGSLVNFGSPGGGALTVLARGAISNATGATIAADGSSGGAGSGGGGGGLVILAAKATVTNGGSISGHGGVGGESTSSIGPGGGGGGGIVHILAPTIAGAGSVDVGGGAAGLANVAVTDDPRSAGSGGGGSGGNGGTGGRLSAGTPAVVDPATDGAAGLSLQSPVDPTALF